jgi:hypothetical protein
MAGEFIAPRVAGSHRSAEIAARLLGRLAKASFAHGTLNTNAEAGVEALRPAATRP